MQIDFPQIPLRTPKPLASISHILSACAIIALLSTPAQAGFEWQGSVESLISSVISQAEKTIGSFAKAPPVRLKWCSGTYYSKKQGVICFRKDFIYSLAEKIGDAAVAYVAAHEYAHHLQNSVPGLAGLSKGNVLRLELQADCFAGTILATIPNIYFDDQDIKEMILTAIIIGDEEYDSGDHHGAGENRALALRSGLRFGATSKKDNYYSMFCNQN